MTTALFDPPHGTPHRGAYAPSCIFVPQGARSLPALEHIQNILAKQSNLANLPVVEYRPIKDKLEHVPKNVKRFSDQDVRKNQELKHGRDTTLDGCALKPLSPADRTYDISRPLLFAPSYLALWALYHALDDRLCGLIISDFPFANSRESAFVSDLQRQWLKLQLSFEKWRMGSDVPSPTILSQLNRQGLWQAAQGISIGDWLEIIAKPVTACRIDREHILFLD